MKQLGMSQHQLAAIVGCTQPAIAALLRSGAKQSALVPKISKAVGLRKPVDPSSDTIDPVRSELVDLLDVMSDDAAMALLVNARLLTGTKKSD
jgi:transcriptional regulator with XRE-family HTH domain